MMISNKTYFILYKVAVVCGAMELGDREMCGYVGITKAACLSKGCCYDNAFRAYPWCFNKPS